MEALKRRSFSMRSLVVALAAGAALVAGWSAAAVQAQAADDPGGMFSDLGDAGVHEPAVRELAAEGVFDGTGCGEGSFCPGEPVERWEMAVWLVRVLDGSAPADPSSTRFGDVGADVWWSPYVERPRRSTGDAGVQGSAPVVLSRRACEPCADGVVPGAGIQAAGGEARGVRRCGRGARGEHR